MKCLHSQAWPISGLFEASRPHTENQVGIRSQTTFTPIEAERYAELGSFDALLLYQTFWSDISNLNYCHEMSPFSGLTNLYSPV